HEGAAKGALVRAVSGGKEVLPRGGRVYAVSRLRLINLHRPQEPPGARHQSLARGELRRQSDGGLACRCRRAQDVLAGRLDGCDVCILLVAYRRGHIPEGETPSITQLEYAIADGLKAVDLEPTEPEYRAGLGQCYAQGGREEEAYSAYREAVRLQPDNSENV